MKCAFWKMVNAKLGFKHPGLERISFCALRSVYGFTTFAVVFSANPRTYTPPSANAPRPSSFFTIGRKQSRSKSSTCSFAFVLTTVSSRTSRLCVCLRTSSSWSLRKSMRPMASARTTDCTSATSWPGVAVSASVRNCTSRSQSCFTTPQYAWLPFARCASSITRHTTSCAGHTPSLRSFSMVCGVQKNSSLVPPQRTARPVQVALGRAHQHARLLGGHAADVAARRLLLLHQRRVGARNTTLPRGNHRRKFFITTAAMSVLPRPVGRHTSEFVNSAARVMSNWYSRRTSCPGYTYVCAVCGSRRMPRPESRQRTSPELSGVPISDGARGAGVRAG